ncbi:MAG: LysR family transcriptional regulator [Bryobacterales bacterium]|nr:LysR family transcriptional regulator [Bryobacteraceae bacterium]MDW8131245.1 LysR family transcriptional regulator [Bryobacterales bacterium]
MDLRQLRYFLAVAQAGSFSRAAEQEGVSQPALSEQIRKLERGLGVPLFERLARGVRLTPAGERLLDHARVVLREMASARRAIESLRTEVGGRLAVGAIPTVLPYLVAPRIEEFRRRYPEVRLRLVEDVTARLLEGLRSGDLDLIVVSLPLREPDLICAELLREPLLAALPADHPLASERELDPRALRNERWLLLRDGHCFRNEVLALCRRALRDPGSLFETDQFTSIIALVAAGFGVSILPAMAAPAARACALVPLRGGPQRRIGYARLDRAFVPPAQLAFTEWLRAVARRNTSRP